MAFSLGKPCHEVQNTGTIPLHFYTLKSGKPKEDKSLLKVKENREPTKQTLAR
jgi:hypothetical protein